jgi:hypothetical protein
MDETNDYEATDEERPLLRAVVWPATVERGIEEKREEKKDEKGAKARFKPMSGPRFD